ncbi:alpha/beta fold hydrolase [Piscirickettsia salmonis]|uniref:alpha/beta fold hydrolase n=1 Tax=Piscirickettsia salmonis TaxID=1238 RepID=UPI0012BB0212|nr:alpha/beta hydrolase [Piscirickettsia salmonis]QGP54771.1 Fluoroacetate dehalogenase [Piscirickettsia salmonis]
MAKLGFTLYGQGKEKVVVYNDWMGDCSSWLPTQPFLDTDTFTYAFIDVRGYGRSLHLQGEYTAKEIVADTLELLETLGWDTFHVIGFSMTGIVTHRMAIDIPERIKSARKRRYLGRYFAHPMMQNRRAKRDDYKPSAVRVTQRCVP